MFNIDERLKGLPAVKEQVVQLFQSLNQPNLAIPGRQAGSAHAWVLGLRGSNGFAVFVYLYLPGSGECAVYVPSNGTVGPDQYQSEEAEALGFVESMGFIMDNLNFRGRPADEQDQFIRTLPVFQREPPPAGSYGAAAVTTPRRAPTGQNASILAIGKLFASFGLAPLFVITACAHIVTEKEREESRIHNELAVTSIVKDPRDALREADLALALDPGNADAWHVKGIVLHTAFNRLGEAKTALQKAIELKEPFSQAHTNLGNLYVDEKRYDDAIKEYEVALNDPLYGDAYIAKGNLGWVYYKKGDARSAVDHLKQAVTMKPGYCLGYLHLGQIADEGGRQEEACKYYGRYRDSCPDQADAWQRDGVCQAKLGHREAALKGFSTCVEKARVDEVREHCQKLKEQLSQ